MSDEDAEDRRRREEYAKSMERRSLSAEQWLLDSGERLRIRECIAAGVDPTFGLTAALALQLGIWNQRSPYDDEVE